MELLHFHWIVSKFEQHSFHPQLERLKSDLRDVLYSHKWTPDAYLLAKAYIAEDDKKDDSDSGSKSSLPKIALKNQTRKL